MIRVLKRSILSVCLITISYFTVFEERHLEPTWTVPDSISAEEPVIFLLIDRNAADLIDELEPSLNTLLMPVSETNIIQLSNELNTLDTRRKILTASDYIENQLKENNQPQSYKEQMFNVRRSTSKLVNKAINANVTDSSNIFATEHVTIFEHNEKPTLSINSMPHPTADARIYEFLASIPITNEILKIQKEILTNYDVHQRLMSFQKGNEKLNASHTSPANRKREELINARDNELNEVKSRITDIIKELEQTPSPKQQVFDIISNYFSPHLVEEINAKDGETKFSKKGAFIVALSKTGILIKRNNIISTDLKFDEEDFVFRF